MTIQARIVGGVSSGSIRSRIYFFAESDAPIDEALLREAQASFGKAPDGYDFFMGDKLIEVKATKEHTAYWSCAASSD